MTRPPTLAQRHRAWLRRHDPERQHLERLTFLTDGVFAIAMTLLAIDIRPPEHWDGRWPSPDSALFHALVGYAISFVVLGTSWAQLRRTTALMRRVDAGSTGLVILCLACVGLVPAAISFQTDYPRYLASFQIYGGVVLALTGAQALLWAYVGVWRDQLTPELPRRFLLGLLAAQGLALAGLALLLAGVAPGASAVEARLPTGAVAAFAVLMAASVAMRRWSQVVPDDAA